MSTENPQKIKKRLIYSEDSEDTKNKKQKTKKQKQQLQIIICTFMYEEIETIRSK